MPRADKGYWLELYKPKDYKHEFWWICYRQNGNRVRKSTGARKDDRGKADQALRDFIGQRAERPTGPSNPNEILVSTVLAIYGEDSESRVADAARIGYAIKALLPFWGEKPASYVNAKTCRLYRRQRKRKNGKPIAPGTVRRELGVLHTALKHCENEGYLTHKPPVTLPEKTPPRERWLTRGEAAALLNQARQPIVRKKERLKRRHLILYILIALYTGARKTSILQLQWQPNFSGGYVDLDRGIIDFSPMSHRRTNKRRQLIPIPRRLLPFLREAKKRTKQYVIEWNGKPCANIRRSFDRAARLAGLKGVNRHTLKHTSITWRMQAGVDIREVADFHNTSEETIRRVYYHHHPDYQKAAANAF